MFDRENNQWAGCGIFIAVFGAIIAAAFALDWWWDKDQRRQKKFEQDAQERKILEHQKHQPVNP